MIEQSIEELMELEVAEQPQEFKIDNDGLAEWAIKKIGEERAERDRLIETAQKQIDYYSAFINHQKEVCDRKTSYLMGKLSSYFRTVKPKETATQLSYKLPSGSLIYKKEKDDYQRDDESLLAWLKKNSPDMVKVTEEPKWGEFKKQLTIAGDKVLISDTGEVVNGISVITKPGAFDVKVDKI